MSKTKVKGSDNSFFSLLLVFTVIVASLLVSVSYISSNQPVKTQVSASTQYVP